MIRAPLLCLAAVCLLAAGCDRPDPSAPDPALTAAAGAATTALPEPPDTASAYPPAAVPPPSAIPAGSAAPVLIPEAEKGEKGARNVLIEWARAIERGDFGRAAAQYGAGSGITPAALRAQFAPLAPVTVGFGDAEVEGAAGSLYYSVPVTARGNGQTRQGEAVLRRVNDVDGASAAQLRWHIERITWAP